MEYPITIYDNHIIAHIDNHNVLIDTGSPVSIGNTDSILIKEKPYSLGKDFQGLNVRELSDLVGTRIDVLLGVDVHCVLTFLWIGNKKWLPSSKLLISKGRSSP